VIRNYGDGMRSVAAWPGPLRARIRRCLGVLLVLVPSLAACGTPAPVNEARPDATIALLRSVQAPNTGGEAAFVEELERLGYRQGDNLEILAADPAEVHTDPADITQTIERWLDAGVDVIVALSTTELWRRQKRHLTPTCCSSPTIPWSPGSSRTRPVPRPT
jgi:hypothetical protein